MGVPQVVQKLRIEKVAVPQFPVFSGIRDLVRRPERPMSTKLTSSLGLLDRLRELLGLDSLPEYKRRSAYYRQRRRMVIMHSPEVGQRTWTTDGRGYIRHKDGSLRRISDPAPLGYLASLRAAWRQ